MSNSEYLNVCATIAMYGTFLVVGVILVGSVLGQTGSMFLGAVLLVRHFTRKKKNELGRSGKTD